MNDFTPEEVTEIFSHQDAATAVENMLTKLKEQDEIMALLQPLLYTMSNLLYGADASTVTLDKLVRDSIQYLVPKTGEFQ